MLGLMMRTVLMEKTKKSLRASLPSTTRSISRDLQVFLFKRGRKECIQREKNLIPELSREGGLHIEYV